MLLMVHLVLTVHGSSNTDGFKFPAVVDVDIGVQGEAIKTSNFLVTFDPFDSLDGTRDWIRLPYAVSTTDGCADFFFNTRIPGCSSLNRPNPEYKTNRTALRHVIPCRGQQGYHNQASTRGFNVLCRNAPLVVKRVRTVQLRPILVGHGVRRIERLKIDTQGSDFTLLQSVLDDAGGASPLIVDSVQLECQNEKQTPRIYERSNDCAAIADYFRMRHPAYRLQTHIANCATAEYNLVASRNPASNLELFATRPMPFQPNASMVTRHGWWRGGARSKRADC